MAAPESQLALICTVTFTQISAASGVHRCLNKHQRHNCGGGSNLFPLRDSSRRGNMAELMSVSTKWRGGYDETGPQSRHGLCGTHKQEQPAGSSRLSEEEKQP